MKAATIQCPISSRSTCRAYLTVGEGDSQVIYREDGEFGCYLLDRYRKEMGSNHMRKCLCLKILGFGETGVNLSSLRLAERRMQSIRT